MNRGSMRRNGRKRSQRGIIGLLAGVIVVGGVFIGCSLFDSDDTASSDNKGIKVISKVASVLGIETEDVDMTSYGDEGGGSGNAATIIKVTAECVMAEGDDITTVVEVGKGGGTVSGTGYLSTASPDKCLEVIPYAEPGYDYLGMSYLGSDGQKHTIMSTQSRKFQIWTSNATPVDKDGYTNIQVSSDPNLVFLFKSETRIISITSAPSAADITIQSGTTISGDRPTGNKVTLNIGTRAVADGYTLVFTANLGTAYQDKYSIDGTDCLYVITPDTQKLVSVNSITNHPEIYGISSCSGIGAGPLGTFKIDFKKNIDLKNYNFVIKLTSKDSQYSYPNQVITCAEPSYGGTTSGDIQSATNQNTNIIATANEGYVFDHWTWIENEQPMSSRDKNCSVTAKGITVYTAHFVSETYSVNVASLLPGDGGTVTGTGTYEKNAKVTLNITPATGYEIESWSYTTTDYVEHKDTNNTITIDKLTENISLHVTFKSTRVRIRTSVSPADTGTAVLTNYDNTISGNTETDALYDKSTDIELKATPKSGFKFLYWSDQNGKHYLGTTDSDGVNTYTIPGGVTEDMTFTANFADTRLAVSVLAQPYSYGDVRLEAGAKVFDYTDKINTNVDSGTTITVSARPADSSYKFVRWDRYEGTTTTATPYTDNPHTETNLSSSNGDVRYIAVFEKVKYTITAKVDTTDSHGSVSVNGGTASQQGYVEVYSGESVTLKATPESGYYFDHWSDSQGREYSGTTDYALGSNSNILKIDPVMATETYTAHFYSNDITIIVSAYPEDAGKVNLNGSLYEKNIVTYVNTTDAKEDNLTMNAIPNDSKYHFDHWERVEKKKVVQSSTSNPYSVLNFVPQDSSATEVRFIAVFSPSKYTIKVEGNPHEGGSVFINDAYKELEVDGGETVTLKASVLNGYFFDYWEDTKGNRYSGTSDWNENGEFNTLVLSGVEASETYTAYFVPPFIEIKYMTDPYGVGEISCNGSKYEESGSVWAWGGDPVTLSARSKDPSEYTLSYWQDDFGNKYSGSPLDIPKVTRNTTFTAVFTKYSKQDTGGLIAYASPAAGGVVHTVYNDDGTATLKAVANSGYSFNCWKHEKKVISSSAETTVSDFADGDTFIAYFTARDGDVVRTGIVSEHFYSDTRHNTTPAYTVTRQSLTFLAAAQTAIDAAKDDTPAQKNYAAFAHAAEYYQNHIKDNEIIFTDGELVTTKGERMPITFIPSGEEAFIDDALAFTLKKFGDKYTTEIIAAVDVAMPEGFENGVRTYLWRNTGAEFKQNVYLLYAPTMRSEYKWSTGVVDIDGSIRFTVEDTGTLARLAAVRVVIE